MINHFQVNWILLLSQLSEFFYFRSPFSSTCNPADSPSQTERAVSFFPHKKALKKNIPSRRLRSWWQSTKSLIAARNKRSRVEKWESRLVAWWKESVADKDVCDNASTWALLCIEPVQPWPTPTFPSGEWREKRFGRNTVTHVRAAAEEKISSSLKVISAREHFTGTSQPVWMAS